MKRWTGIALVLGLIILASSAGLYWKLPWQKLETVMVVEASFGTLEQTITATGSVEARRKVLVTAEPGARIAALYFNEQDLVANGQVLAKLDDSELSTQRRQMEGAHDLAKANLADAEATLKRIRSLYEQGYMAHQEVEASQLQVDIYRTQVQDKKAALRLLKTKLEQTLIRAPVGGARELRWSTAAQGHRRDRAAGRSRVPCGCRPDRHRLAQTRATRGHCA
jgi:HlyD family secretion protein